MKGEDSMDIRSELYEEAYEWACQRATEEGDVDIDRDYKIMESWQEEYYQYLCREEGIEP